MSDDKQDLEPQKDAKGGLYGDSDYDVHGKKPGGKLYGDSDYDVKGDTDGENFAPRSW